MPLPILTANTQYTAALIDLQKKKTLLTKRSSKMDIFDTTSQEVVKATNDIAKEVETLEPVSEDREKAGKQLVEIKVSLIINSCTTTMYYSHWRLRDNYPLEIVQRRAKYHEINLFYVRLFFANTGDQN